MDARCANAGVRCGHERQKPILEGTGLDGIGVPFVLQPAKLAAIHVAFAAKLAAVSRFGGCDHLPRAFFGCRLVQLVGQFQQLAGGSDVAIVVVGLGVKAVEKATCVEQGVARLLRIVYGGPLASTH